MDNPAGAADNYVIRALELFADYGDREAIVFGETRLTYAEVRSEVLALARLLHENGVKPGAGVALIMKNRPEAVAMQLALHLLGCRTVWIATYAPYRDQIEFVRLADVEVLIYHTNTVKGGRLVEELTAPGAAPLSLFYIGSDGQGTEIPAHLPDAAAGSPELDPALAGPDPSSLFYSGGTTGRPKLVRHDQGFYKSLLMIGAYYVSIKEPLMRHLAGSGFTHVSGQMPGFLALFEGGTFLMHEGMSPARFLEIVEREQVTSAFLTPTQLYEITAHPDSATRDTSTLRYLNVGGAAASPARLAEAIDRFGPVVRLVYGSSEMPLITDLPFLDHDPEHPQRLSSCGKPFADIAIEIRNEDGKVLDPGETGEVWTRSSMAMAGYWQDPELTKATLVDGWVRTGDIGHLDADGYLYLVDRLNDMIVTSADAANVYARVIEDVLTSHPKVYNAAVIGVPDEQWGEAVCAYVVTAPGASVDAQELRDLVRTELNAIHEPRDVEFVDALPVTGIGKVDKKQLRSRHAAPAGS
jgi:fatty-acyl-CoA synthase